MEKSEQKTAIPVSFLTPAFLILIAGVPMMAAGATWLAASSNLSKLVCIGLFPVIFSAVYVATSAALSVPFHKAIIRGKFPRQLTHVVYGPRRLYGLCWGAVFYCTPVYYAFMSVPTLRKFLLRSFGYRGDADINLAPDAWIRDLPMLNFKRGVYVANKATVGTNICLADGHVLVDHVTLGEGTLIGHMTMIAPGCTIGDRSEIGVGCGIGIRVRVGDESRIGPTTTINHGAQIGSKVDVGTMSYIGLKAKIADGIKIPSGANIPEGAEIRSQEDVSSYVRSESRALSETRSALGEIFASRAQRPPIAPIMPETTPITKSG